MNKRPIRHVSRMWDGLLMSRAVPVAIVPPTKAYDTRSFDLEG